MALTETEGNGFIMPVAPSNNGFGGFGGGDGLWILILFILLAGGNGFGGGFGGGNGLYPWLNNTDNINGGFRDQLLNTNIMSIRDGISGISTQLCNGFAGTNAAIANGFAQSEIAANARQMADMNQQFALQSSLQNCCCENRLATANTQSIVQSEGAATRLAIQNQTQQILDKLCQQEIDTLKERNLSLQNQLNMATLRESQTAQNALIAQGFSNEVDALYNRLNSCPVPTTPVYGRTPIFTCNNNCGCNG